MKTQQSSRTGRYVEQPGGYSAFIPAPLPPDPAVDMTGGLSQCLSDADRAVGRLDGVASLLPNPDLFVAMYVRHEAVLSSQIEGTQSTLEDVLEYETGATPDTQPRDVEEVMNYVRAMNHGLERLEKFPLSLRLIREIHEKLMEGVRGQHRNPGEFRESQNWVGSLGTNLNQADYVPPPPHEMMQALGNLEEFFHSCESMPVLIHCGLAHAQFETIHPFLDGNGRVGRLLITFLLCRRNVLDRPLLYLSYYLKANRSEYYDRLMKARHEGDWEGWLEFFLNGVTETSQAATETAREILALRERSRDRVGQELSGSPNALRLLDFAFERPVLSVRMAEESLDCSYGTARNLVGEFEKLGLLREITGQKRNRRYRFDPYIEVFERQSLPSPGNEELQQIATTEAS
ncbi:MAG: Fic family protein [Candidatus Brocadiia bacterium]